ncbi:MAG: phospholipase D-like domain-containing protein [Bdellovibrionota bacterium]
MSAKSMWEVDLKCHWRGLVMITGPAVRQMEEVFFNDWEFATGEKISDEFKPLKQFQTERDSQPKIDFGRPSPFVQVVPSGPSDPTMIGILAFSQMIRTARERIWIATPYFVPDEALQRDLELAVLRGVDVRILLPKISDHRFVHWVTLSYAEQMQVKGLRFFLYEQGFTHQKVTVIDNDLCSIGTANFDNRAMYLNFETLVLIHGEYFTAEVAAMLLNDFDASCEFVRVPYKHGRLLTRLRDNAARLLAPLL